MRLLKKIILAVFILMILVILLMHFVSGKLRGPIDDVTAWSQNNPDKIAVVNEELGRYLIRENNKQDSLPLLIMIHGAPGSWDAFVEYLKDDELSNHFVLLSIDRLGYGQSQYGQVATIDDQVEWIKSIVEIFPNRKVFLMGHSYGGPIAAAYQMKYSDAEAIIMLAPVVDPENEKIFWFSYPMKWSWTQWIFPKWIQVSTEEKFMHADQLELYRNEWKKIDVPIVHLYDSEDWIAPGKENALFLKEHVNPAIFIQKERPGKSHFIPWEDMDYVKKMLLGYISLKD